MNLRRFLPASLVVLTLVVGTLALHAHPAFAQQTGTIDTAGLQVVGQTANMGNADPRVIAARIINIFLGTLGTILLGLIIYAGFLWTTAGGDADKVERAQKTIRNAIVGLIIIVLSWAFVSYIIKQILAATGGQGGVIANTDTTGMGGELGASGGSLAFQVRSITPVGDVRIRNVEVRFLFSREVMASSATSSIVVLRAADHQPVAGTITTNGTLVSFVPNDPCPAPNADRKCFAENTEYIAQVLSGLRSSNGLTIACRNNTPACTARFRTGSVVDVNPPNAVIVNPLDGQGIPAGDSVRVSVRESDDGGLSLTEVFVDGHSIGRDAGSASTTPLTYDASVVWDTRGVATGTHTIVARAWDIDSNSVTTTPVTVAIRPRSFFNGIQDGGTPELGCGQPGQGACLGSVCSTGAACFSRFCVGGVCVPAPTTETGCGTPGHGACIGSSCTLPADCYGHVCEFGVCRGPVETGPDCGGIGGGLCSGATSTVPVACASGTIDNGHCTEQPIIGSFNPVNGRPGTFVTITGVNFGTSTGRVMFAGLPAHAPAACIASGTSWSPTQIIVSVPEGAASGSIQVIHVNGLSDATNDDRGPRLADFAVNTLARPGLCSIRPGSATVGQYIPVRISGTSLGDTSGHVYFNEHDVPITQWQPSYIDLVTPLVAPGGYQVQAQQQDLYSNTVNFDYSPRLLTAPPTIDEIRPASGPKGSYVTLIGHDFGTTGVVYFRNPTTGALGQADTNFPAGCGSSFWQDGSITVKVPQSLHDGLNQVQDVAPGSYEVYVQRDALSQSNHVGFTVTLGAPGPGICAIEPVAGPIGTGVTILGEHFGTSAGTVTFATGSVSVVARPQGVISDSSWTDGKILTRVPDGAGTGAVLVNVGGQISNEAFYTVASCRNHPEICGEGSACCSDGSCAVGGACPYTAIATSTFAWRTSTGPVFHRPSVVDECTMDDMPSPSPRGDNICVNAQAVVRFNMHLNPATINDSNVIVQRCVGMTTSTCATGGTPTRVHGSIRFVGGETQDAFVFTPMGEAAQAYTWAASTTYEVILKPTIQASSTQGGLSMLENADAFGAGNAYAYLFTTRQSTDLCAASSVAVIPSVWTFSDIGQQKDDYGLSARAAGDMCVQINADTLGWNWSVSDAGRIGVMPNNSADSSSSTVSSLGATEDTPVNVIANLTRPVPPTPVEGRAKVYVSLAAPQVVDYAPHCDQACVNAMIWARFNVPIQRTSITHNGLPNMQVQLCTNEACDHFVRTLDLSQAQVSLDIPPGTSSTEETMLKLEATVPTSVIDPVSHQPTRMSQLEAGRFYKVTIFGGADGIHSAHGNLPMVGLNESQPDGFSWKFRVKSGPNAHCDPDHILIAPSVKYEIAIGLRQMFVSTPVSVPDACSRTGQLLVTESSTQWDSSDTQVADFATVGGSTGSLSLADQLPPFCTNQCLNAGSNGVAGVTAVCGDHIVETTDLNYCHLTSDPTRTCAVGDTNCVTKFGDACRILPSSATESEECDAGTANSATGECSTSCLWNPQRRVTDPRVGTCGDGIVQRGEQCDPGRICVSQTSTPGVHEGQTCTNSSDCGTGSLCQVVARHGCSDTCQALGSAAGGSTCGNGDLSYGETCDYLSTGRAPGCTEQCLHTGSSSAPRRLCGNGIPEDGESCEKGPGGEYCRVTRNASGVLALDCSGGTHFTDFCDATTCLDLGTRRCAHLSSTGCCGNNIVEPGEECDGGEGCTLTCLLRGSSVNYAQPSVCGDRVIGRGEQCDAPPTTVGGTDTLPVLTLTNRQLFQITGLRAPTSDEITHNQGRMKADLHATYASHTGQATYGVQCSYTMENECLDTSGHQDPTLGLTSGGCCAVRPQPDLLYPHDGASGVCRNVLIHVDFNQSMDQGSVRGNFLISRVISGTTTCPAGTRPLTEVQPVAFDWHAPLRSFVALVRSWFAPVDAASSVECAGVVQGTVVFEEVDHKTTAAFLLDQPLDAQTEYHVTLLGDANILTEGTSSTRVGMRAANGVFANGNITWSFKTGDRICTIDDIRIIDSIPQHPAVFYHANEAHRYVGRAVSYNGNEVVPLSPIHNVYDWIWRDWLSSRPNILTTVTATTTPQVSMATTTSMNQRGTSFIGTGVLITADRVSTVSTVGTPVDSSLLSTVLLCDNPWVPPGTLPGQPPRFEDDTYHFGFQYCLDAGQAGTGDDLPHLLVNRQPVNAADAARGVEEQYIFTFSEPAFRTDAIGIRVMSNPLHFSPLDWYRAQGFGGAPQSSMVDGYEAVRDGSTVYIEAANVTTDGTLTTDIYVVTYNAGATAQTKNIFDQILQVLTFNLNVRHDADNVCHLPSGTLMHVTGANSAVGSSPVTCTADWECARYDGHAFCASAKDKLQRDLKRIADLQYIDTALEATKQRTGRYPQLNTGTFLNTFVSSRWPSWQSVFAAALGKALPEDPLNVHLSCGRCFAGGTACMEDSDCTTNDRCVSVDGFDPLTCWNATNSTYRCPVLEPTNVHSVSRTYQYRSVDNGNRFQLGTELEYLPIAFYSPAITPETRRCVSTGASDGRVCYGNTDCTVYAADHLTVVATGTCQPEGGQLTFGGMCSGRQMGLGGICGDGVVGTGETCEPGQTLAVDCPIHGVAGAGTWNQVCRADCHAWVNDPTAVCVPKIQCGNGRIETGEICDDGALNGTYGHCNRTCSGFAAMCGDHQLSAGETCDLGDRNGQYYDTLHPSATDPASLNLTCSADCHDVAPHCGDGVVQSMSLASGGVAEECDTGSAAQVTTSALCSNDASLGKACRTDADCNSSASATDGHCGGYTMTLKICQNSETFGHACNVDTDCNPVPTSPFDVVSMDGRCAAGPPIAVRPQDAVCAPQGLCVGGLHDHQSCTCPAGQASCADHTGLVTGCGADAQGHPYSCNLYPTQRTKVCTLPSGNIPVANQCHWGSWSECRPAHFCGDGILDPGEDCDDGNRNDNDACTNRCKVNVCGDGVMQVGVEECDFGALNGHPMPGAEYGSTVAACTNRCRMTASSGGYCGDGIKNGAEQCDGTDLGLRAGQAPQSCSSLGFDYAARARCTSVTDGTQIEVDTADIATRCRPGSAQDIITCNNTCGYTGCQVCATTPGTNSITGQVLDAVQSVNVPGAIVTLEQNGRRIATQNTDTNGNFTFPNLNGNSACNSYRVFVEFTGDTPGTLRHESDYGGYWPYESSLFIGTQASFNQSGVVDPNGKIYLLPRVGRDESLVVHEWYGSLSGRYLLAHLILPPQRAYNRVTSLPYSPASCGMTHPDASCFRDIHEENGSYGLQGDPDINQVPYARLFCAYYRRDGHCFEADTGPQAIDYRLNPSGIDTGTFSFYLVDQRSTSTLTGATPTPSSHPPSYQWYSQTQSRVYVITSDRVYEIHPPAFTPTRCSGKYWLVYQQNAQTGAVTVPSPADAYQCGGAQIPNEPSGTKYLPDDHWIDSIDTGGSSSWLQFGGIRNSIPADYLGIDWDMPR